MTIYITQTTKREDLEKALTKMRSGKKLDAKKFCGVIKWSEDGLAYQKKLRSEWTKD